MQLRSRLASITVITLLVGCSSSDPASETPVDPTDPTEPEGMTPDPEPLGDGLTYERDLRPVIESNCYPCHATGSIAPFTLESHDDLAENIDAVIAAVNKGIMPPWYANDDCHPIADSRRLPDETRALFSGWRDDGMQQGDPTDYVAPPAREIAKPTEPPTRTLQMPSPHATYRPAPGQEDEQRCFLLPQTFERDTFIKAFSVRPSTRTVHHLQVHRIPEQSIADAEARDAASPGPGYPCFGESAPGSYNLYSWHPGSEVVAYPPGEAQFLSAGARIALQIHFNVDFLLPEDEVPEEVTSVDFWELPEDEPPDYVIVRFFLDGGALYIPPGEPEVLATGINSMATASNPGGVFVPGEFIGHTPHMHYLGSGYNATIIRANGEAECLVDMPDWEFDWQLDYWYPPDRYIPFDVYDEVIVQCEYDNSPANQPFIGGEQRIPQLVEWGDSSSDEMCLNHTWVRYEREAYLNALRGF